MANMPNTALPLSHTVISFLRASTARKEAGWSQKSLSPTSHEIPYIEKVQQVGNVELPPQVRFSQALTLGTVMPMSQAESIGYDILCNCCFSGSEMSRCMGMETKSVSFEDPMAKPQTLALHSIHPPHDFNQYDHDDLICFERRFLSSTLDEMTFLFDARHLSANIIQTKTPTPRSSFLVIHLCHKRRS